jgi:hypothetical protein
MKNGIVTDMFEDPKAADAVIFRLVITETGKPTSWDPLDADNTENLIRARMVYAQFFSINEKNELESNLFETFRYDLKTNTIFLKLMERHYSDGNLISSEDVVYSIKRMLLRSPTFPIIEFISGKQKWLSLKHPLHSDISGITTNKNEIRITLDKTVKHPFFRLALELFSVLPRHCFDLSGALNCKTPPASGFYTQTKETTQELEFLLRDDLSKIDKKDKPKFINFFYPDNKSVNDLISLCDSRTAILTSEALFSPSDLKTLKSNVSYKDISGVRFGGYLINSKNKNFIEGKSRNYFSREFYAAVSSILIFDVPKRSRSIFSEILPGYLSDADLTKDELAELPTIKSKVRAGKLSYGVHGVFYQALERMNNEYFDIVINDSYKTREQMVSDFMDGSLDIIPLSSGFWPLDPVSDLKMFFTPHMHQDLFILQRDKILQSMLEKAKFDSKPVAVLEKINRYLFNAKDYNVFINFNRFLFSKKNCGLEQMPIGTLIPSPWQVFKHYK